MGLTLTNLRLPMWLLPKPWPMDNNRGDGSASPELANIEIDDDGVIAAVTSVAMAGTPITPVYDAQGALALPPLIDAHVHLDKTYTRARLGEIEPGLLNAIAAMKRDHQRWSEQDLFERSERALKRSYANGCILVRTHVDWHTEQTPLAWQVFERQAERWRSQLCLERVALVPLTLLADRNRARAIIANVKGSRDAVMGGFIHSSNFDQNAMQILLEESQAAGVDLDLHIDEELAAASGLKFLAHWLSEHEFSGRIVCGHSCALSQLDDDEALALLDQFIDKPVTFIALPATNLLLQDATPNRTPRLRGLTLVHEMRARGIAVMFASDNVGDGFCAYGDYNPLDALLLGIYSAQLNAPFDVWSQAVCDRRYLSAAHSAGPHRDMGQTYKLIGQPADWLLFDSSELYHWPQPNYERPRWKAMRRGVWLDMNSGL